jgi:hypothetical protein
MSTPSSTSYLTANPCTTNETVVAKSAAQGFLDGMLSLVGAGGLVGGNPITDLSSTIQSTNNQLIQTVATNNIIMADNTQSELSDIIENINAYQEMVNKTIELNNLIINGELGKLNVGLISMGVLVFVIIICEIIYSSL